jgi:hypothetical protein
MNFLRSIVADEEYVPVPPLPLTEAELKNIDEAIAQMVKIGRRRSITAARLRYSLIMEDVDLCKRTDELIAETLTALKRIVPDDTGEKLFERISKVVDGWADVDEQNTLAIIFYRLMDSMRFMVAYRGKFRGKERKSSMSKSEALAELKERGIGKR